MICLNVIIYNEDQYLMIIWIYDFFVHHAYMIVFRLQTLISCISKCHAFYPSYIHIKMHRQVFRPFWLTKLSFAMLWNTFVSDEYISFIIFACSSQLLNWWIWFIFLKNIWSSEINCIHRKVVTMRDYETLFVISKIRVPLFFNILKFSFCNL